MSGPTRRQRRTIMVGTIGLVAAGATVGLWTFYARLTDPDRIRREAASYLEQWIQARVEIESASHSLSEGVRLSNVRILPSSDVSRSPGEASRPPLLSIPQVTIAHDPLALLRGRLLIKSILAERPVVTLVHDAETGWSSLAGLFRRAPVAPRVMATLPLVELRGARLDLVERTSEGEHRRVEELDVTIRAKQSLESPGLLDLTWSSDSDARSSGHSRIDLTTGYLRNVRGGLPAMSIGAVMLAIDAGYEGADALTRLLGLQGRLRAVDYNLIHSGPDDPPPSVTIDLNDASLSIPIDASERGLPPGERYLRFAGVNGNILITSDQLSADFSGRLHGSECRVRTRIRGNPREVSTLDDVHLDAELTIKGLTLPRPDADAPPEQQRFIRRWPQLVDFYEDYDPTGSIDIELQLMKPAGPDSKIEVRRALLTARGGSASCIHFPYRGDRLTGQVEYTPSGVFVRNLCGKRGSANICVNVEMEAPRKSSSARVDITADRVPIDDALLAGLSPKHRRIVEAFSPDGVVHVAVNLDRPSTTEGRSAPWTMVTHVLLDRCSATYEGLPYPIDDLTGRIEIEYDRIRIRELTGRAGAGLVTVNGAVELDDHDVAAVDLQIDSRQIAVDETLLSSLPRSVSDPLRHLHPSGRLDAVFSISRDHDSPELRVVATVEPRRLALRYDQFPLPIEDVTGRIVLSNGRIDVQSMTGRFEDAEISASGAIDLHPTNPSIRLSVNARDLRLNDAFREAAPDAVRELLSEWKVDDPIAVDARVSSSPDGGDDLRWQAVARLNAATVRHRRFPIPFHEVRAEIFLDPTGVRADGINARYAKSAVHVDIDVRRTARGEEGILRIYAVGATLDATIRDLLPRRIQSVWDELDPRGRLDVYFDELRYSTPSPGDPPVWKIHGRTEFRDAVFAGISDSTGIDGTISLDGFLVDRLGGTTLSGRFDLPAVVVHGHALTDITGNWLLANSAGGVGRLSLANVGGRMHDGAVSAQSELLFDGPGTAYKLTFTTQGVQLARWIDASRPDRGESAGVAEPPVPTEISGLVDSHLYLSGDWGRSSSRRGGGRLAIRAGHLYRLPILLAILNRLNIVNPKSDVIDEARVEYFIDGETASLTDILLRGEAISLIGAGTYSIPDRSVDLTLYSLGSGRWDGIPVLSELMRAASREIVQLRVTGPLSQPVVRPSPFGGVTREIQNLFQKRRPRSAPPGGP